MKFKRKSAAAGLMLPAALLLFYLLYLNLPVQPVQTEMRPRSLPSVQTAEITVFTSTSFINQATWTELTAIPEIGEKLAQAIVTERETNGPFFYPEDLLAVSGIGEKKLEKLKNWLAQMTETE